MYKRKRKGTNRQVSFAMTTDSNLGGETSVKCSVPGARISKSSGKLASSVLPTRKPRLTGGFDQNHAFTGRQTLQDCKQLRGGSCFRVAQRFQRCDKSASKSSRHQP